jgi:hypothetical protein
MNWRHLPELVKARPADTKLSSLQANWLMRCLTRNRDTAYGRRYDFAQINSIPDYQQQLPLVEYDDLHPWVALMAMGQTNVLFSGKTIAFERSSGTTSVQKLIPYSAESLKDFRCALLPWLASLASQYGITSGTAYWAISPATRQSRVTLGGTPIGLPDSAYLGGDLADFFLQTSAVPLWLAELEAIDEWQLATLYFLVRSANLQLVSVWSPTFLLMLMEAMHRRELELEQALSTGLNLGQHRLPADPLAHRRLRTFYASNNPKDLWPRLKLISCWADASSRPYYFQLKSLFSDIPIQPKGLLSTEAVITVPDHMGHTLLAPHSGFYEFIDDREDIYLAHELEVNQKYQVILTTSGGLYRYRGGDWVLCLGYVGNLPELRFIGREQTSDLAGEKLSEAFVDECLAEIEGFRMLLALKDNPGYCLVLETAWVSPGILQRVERALCCNPHYAYARKLGQLQPLKLLALDNPTEHYLSHALQRGGRLGDIKLPLLCFEPELFIDYLEQSR